jgi:hypothetical protein
MSILRLLIVLLLVLVGAAAGFWAYMGGFAQVSIERGSYGPADIVYTTHRGSYSGLGDSWERFQSEWEAAGATECDSLAVYLDSPQETAEEDLRSILACRIDTASQADRAALESAFPSFTIPQSDALLATHPYKNYLSFMVGPVRVYPAMEKRMADDGLEASIAIELYGRNTAPMTEVGFAVPVSGERSEYQTLMDAF